MKLLHRLSGMFSTTAIVLLTMMLLFILSGKEALVGVAYYVLFYLCVVVIPVSLMSGIAFIVWGLSSQRKETYGREVVRIAIKNLVVIVLVALVLAGPDTGFVSRSLSMNNVKESAITSLVDEMN